MAAIHVDSSISGQATRNMVGFNSIAKYKTVAKSCQAQYLQTSSLYTHKRKKIHQAGI